MADADETCDTILRELNNVVSCDTDRTKEEQESSSSHQEAVSSPLLRPRHWNNMIQLTFVNVNWTGDVDRKLMWLLPAIVVDFI